MGNHSRKSVFVVGAGASKEFSLPTGDELKLKISEITRITSVQSIPNGFVERFENETFRSHLHALSKTKNFQRFKQHATFISINMPLAPSIDNFLHTHQDNEDLISVGKLAIAQAILHAEEQSPLKAKINIRHGNIRFDKLNETWIKHLFSLLVTNTTGFDDFLSALRNITFVSFNYDRCIHQFFTHASKSYFSLTNVQVQEVIDSLDILYPYGNVGEFKISDKGTTFGAPEDINGVLDAANSVRTFMEGVDSGLRDELQDRIKKSDTLVFLGFSYMQMNLELLLNENPIPKQFVLGTTLGISEDSKKLIRGKLRSKFRNSDMGLLNETTLQLVEKKCFEFFDEFKERLLS